MTLHREILLDISEIEESRNPFAIAFKMMKGLSEGKLKSSEYENLSKELEHECKKNDILTENKVCSLF